jgi:hypothetical protein
LITVSKFSKRDKGFQNIPSDSILYAGKVSTLVPPEYIYRLRIIIVIIIIIIIIIIMQTCTCATATHGEESQAVGK